eukprot:57336-Prorocentrum_lima.AAC.1
MGRKPESIPLSAVAERDGGQRWCNTLPSRSATLSETALSAGMAAFACTSPLDGLVDAGGEAAR